MLHIMYHMVQQKKEYFITVRVNEKMYIEISSLASEMEEGNISRFIRNLLKTVIKNAKNL